MKELNLRSFIKESGLLEEVQRMTRRTNEGLPDEENPNCNIVTKKGAIIINKRQEK